MAQHKLLVDDFYDSDYALIAIHSDLQDYHLAYVLNKSFSLNLKRNIKDLDFVDSNTNYSIYEWYNSSEDVTWHLISNICKKEEIDVSANNDLFSNTDTILKNYNLIPEHKHVDYFIKISNEVENIDTSFAIKTLQNTPKIITSFLVNPMQLKSKEHLIF